MSKTQDIQDVNALTAGGLTLDRRSLLKGATLGGFAIAANPILAQAITTSRDGLIEGRSFVDVGDDDMFAYVAKPADKAAKGVVLVVPEIFGVHAYLEDVCRRFAHQGYFAISPEIFFRHADPGQFATVASILKNVISKMDDAQVMSDLDATFAFAKEDGASTDNLAITGFCWGGRITWLYAAHNPSLKGAVAWYGRLVGEQSELTPKHPVDVVDSLHVPVLGLYGGQDESIPLDTVEQMRAALAGSSNKAAKQSKIEVFAEAKHGFHADYRSSYNPSAAKQAYNLALDYLTGRFV